MSKKKIHVMPSPHGGWSVRSSGSERAIKVFDTQKAAVDVARVRAKERGVELFVHKKDGRIKEAVTYSSSDKTARKRT